MKTRVLFVQYTNPAGFPPIERAARILKHSGREVRLVGADGIGTDPLAARTLRDLDVRLVSRAGRGIVQKLQYARFLLVCAYHILTWRPDWVYASDTFAAPIGVVGRIAGVRVIYHEHDAPTDPSPTVFIRLILRARRMLLGLATILVTPNEERSSAMSAEAGGRTVLTVWNCPSRSEVQGIRHAIPNGALKLVYHGSIVPGRPPIAIVDAMARANDHVELHVTGYETQGSRGYTADIMRRARERGIGDRVFIGGAVPREELLVRASRCDLGLCFMPADNANFNEARMAGASNKAFEYLACGVPIVVSDLPDWRRIFVDREVAWACDPSDVEGMTELLGTASADRLQLRRMGERGRELIIKEWNYETQFAPVVRAMAMSGRDDAGESQS